MKGIRSTPHVILGVLILVFLSACGGGGGDGGGPTGGGAPAGIGSNGGIATSSDGKASVNIPAGALSQETAITVTVASNPASGYIGTAYEFGPSGTAFSQPVTISITYDESALPSGMKESDLKLATITNNQWRIVTSSPADTTANVVNGTTVQLSTYGVKASRLNSRAQELLIGKTCGTSDISCVSLRVPDNAICKGNCADSVAEMLLAEGIAVLDSAPKPDIGPVPLACVGFRPDIAGTEEGAVYLVDLLGQPYRLENIANGIQCNIDGFPYSVYVE